MLGGGSRIYHHHQLGIGLGLDFATTRIAKLSSFISRPSSFTLNDHTYSNCHRFQQRLVSSSSLRSKSPGEIPIVSDCFSQQEDDHDSHSDGLSAVAGGIVALGKFDALHIGHRELAIQASKVGTPFLLSFVGIAEVLGWEPRAPIVAKCDRSRVLASWAPYCGNVSPSEFHIEFSSVRHLNPMQFVEKLSKELKVSGVVAGENYRFGYKAAGDASDLVRLCEEYGIGAYIINSVMDKSADPKNMYSIDLKDKGQVSSTRVRHALSIGDMKHVSELLGRRHRLVLMLNDQKRITRSKHRCRISAPKSCLLNLPPKDGFYESCYLILDEENPLRCNVLIDSNYTHIETEGVSSHTLDIHILGVEFGY